MQRKYDYRLIKSHRPYTLISLAKLLDVHPATIRAWIKNDGLSCAVVADTRPMILSGAKVKAWMEIRQKAKKRPCASNEMCIASNAKTRAKSPKVAFGSSRAIPKKSR